VPKQPLLPQDSVKTRLRGDIYPPVSTKTGTIWVGERSRNCGLVATATTNIFSASLRLLAGTLFGPCPLIPFIRLLLPSPKRPQGYAQYLTGLASSGSILRRFPHQLHTPRAVFCIYLSSSRSPQISWAFFSVPTAPPPLHGTSRFSPPSIFPYQ
jgi:hypothetical protein